MMYENALADGLREVLLSGAAFIQVPGVVEHRRGVAAIRATAVALDELGRGRPQLALPGNLIQYNQGHYLAPSDQRGDCYQGCMATWGVWTNDRAAFRELCRHYGGGGSFGCAATDLFGLTVDQSDALFSGGVALFPDQAARVLYWLADHPAASDYQIRKTMLSAKLH